MENLTLKRLPAIAILIVTSSLILPGCQLYYRHRSAAQVLPTNPGDQPDKILFEKASQEIDHGRYDVGRLTLQTLINTYPDSEYLSKAKLEIADSYYNEGGVSGLTQAEAEYKDFITFFPTAPEAPMAQFRVGMAHYRLMAKADRDRTEARLAEAELKEFLLKYPDSPLIIRVKRRLRETQEVLGEAEYKTAEFYYLRGSYPAARSRLQDIVEKYPNFSGGDRSLYYLAKSYEHLRQSKEAIPYYDRILTDFPLSPYTKNAKAQLTVLHQPIPRPTKAMLARARADAARREQPGVFQKMTHIMSSAPDTSQTLHGPVRLGAPQPGEVEVAKTTPAAAPAGNATIVLQPASDASLNAGKPVDTKAESTTSAENSTAKAADSSSKPSTDTSSDVPVAPKKKSRFNRLKRLIPF